MPNKNRNKGNNYERQIAKEMRLLGFENCATSRYVSREQDDKKVDLCYTQPFNIQCKSVERLSYFSILKEMPEDENYNVIFNKKKRQGEIVVMWKEDFYELVNILKKENIL